jgi:hypothetical protein
VPIRECSVQAVKKGISEKADRVDNIAFAAPIVADEQHDWRQ